MSMELLGQTREQLRAYCKVLGEPAYRAGQLYHALYAERKFDIARMTNLPSALREKLGREATVTLPVVRQRYASSDGSVRYLFGLNETKANLTAAKQKKGPAAGAEEKTRPRGWKTVAVEAVFMPSDGRRTICISTQAGCAVDCHFCLTAQLGLIRNLTAGEMVGQVLVPLEEMGKPSESEGAQTNVVLMGQGEPLLNFENTMAALGILLDEGGVGLSPKHVTLSTSGIVPGIEHLAKEEVRPKLAISLNASCDEQRDLLMPINRKYPLKVLMDACRKYPLRNWEYLTFEYVMLGAVNDAPADARRLVKLLAPLKRVKVNLIPWNPGELPYKESSAEQIEDFRKILTNNGVPAFVRYSRGRDVMAACGQLALKELSSFPLTVIG
jgi:23S rRNA (adenine2503-C2)-methyltransferase